MATFEQRLKGGEDRSHSDISGKSILSKEYKEGTASTKAQSSQGIMLKTLSLEESQQVGERCKKRSEMEPLGQSQFFGHYSE